MNWEALFIFTSDYFYQLLTVFVFIINIIFAISLVFLERRSAQSVWAWIMILLFLPVIGFILYMLFGRTIYRKELFTIDEEDKVGLEYLVSDQLEAIQNQTFEFSTHITEKHFKLVHMLLNNNQSYLTTHNTVETFTTGEEKFQRLLKDIEAATDHIHFQYYIFKLDGIGKKLYDAMLKKQRQGVKVRILYDDIGSRALSLRNFKNITYEGGEVEAFFPSMLPLINPRVNNRNHRKVVVIDGKVGYIGGFNVGDEYLGLSKKFGHWRDTHLRVEGDVVYPLQLRFMLDWNSHAKRKNLRLSTRYFPENFIDNHLPMQIASSGPDERWQTVKYGYLKMIYSAQKSIYIQSPYFIPDQSFYEAVKTAILAGIDVNIMIPCKPDHPFVYWGTYSNAGSLATLGANVYIYQKGFMHQKVVMIDDEVLSVGTTNIDNRSFLLNFEVNAFIYDKNEARNMRKIFERDIKDSTVLTPEKYDSRSRWVRFKESIANLISPLL